MPQNREVMLPEEGGTEKREKNNEKGGVGHGGCYDNIFPEVCSNE